MSIAHEYEILKNTGTLHKTEGKHLMARDAKAPETSASSISLITLPVI